MTAPVTSERRHPPLAQANSNRARSRTPIRPSVHVASMASSGSFVRALFWLRNLATLSVSATDPAQQFLYLDISNRIGQFGQRMYLGEHGESVKHGRELGRS